MSQILTSLHGRRCGLTKEVGIRLNKGKSNRLSLLGQSVVVRVPTASVLTLNATPYTLLAAQGSGIATVVTRVAVYKPAGTAYAGIAAGEDLVVKYTNGSGAQISAVIEATGFLDQTTAQTRIAFPPTTTGATAGDINPVANAAVVLHMLTGEVTTGNSDLYVELFYDLMQTVFTD